MSYPDDLTFEQVINCKEYNECLIHLIFVDFQISEESIVEVSIACTKCTIMIVYNYNTFIANYCKLL